VWSHLFSYIPSPIFNQNKYMFYMSGELIEARSLVESCRVNEQKSIEEDAKLRADLQKSHDLITKLESDLENSAINGNRQSSTRHDNSPGSNGRPGMSAPDASLVALLSSGGNESNRNGAGQSQTLPSGGAGEGQMLAILTSQRDRYKERLDVMEGNMFSCGINFVVNFHTNM
jgi:hypothetical protein